jgi:type IV secretory pathway VirB2 component (pilin)
MNFFSKQISTIFLSLSFFLISSEGWAGTQILFVNNSDCLTKCGGTSGNGCFAAETEYDFKGTDAGGNTNLIQSYTTGAAGSSSGQFADTSKAAGSKSDCMSVCTNLCIEFKGGYAGEYAKASTSSNTFSKSICNAFRIVTGSAGKTFAAFAIIATGIGFFSGKVSWGLMIGVAAGIATMFGAPSIVAAISGSVVDTKCGLATGMPGS